ncbi:glycogen/starch synthase [Patescibacteria group bacterium]|nr:glycogen/starch synthase [Patescibacteria group bacterium]
MKVLLPASEVAPLIKFGGLGDVIGSLPKALEKIGVDVDVVVPYYPTVDPKGSKIYKNMDLHIPFGEKNNIVEVHKTKLPDSNVDVLLFKNAEYFTRGGKSAFENNVDETEMFSFFDRCVVEYVKARFNTYDLIHCNDWHTGLITHILADELDKERPATLFTIHNLMYQGVGGLNLVRELGFTPGSHPLIDWDIADGDLNMLQQGITSSDYISTVSKTYAKEMLTPEFGGDLCEVLQAREGRITGILNGINYGDFPRDFDETDWLNTKNDAKNKLYIELNLNNSDVPIPLFSFIGRLDGFQKGLDILYESIPHILDSGGHFVLLGTGEERWQNKLNEMSENKRFKGKLSINIIFDVDLAVKIYKSSDFLVVPSRYEPCGLIQMIAMHYGTVPVVHGVGGLKDSVRDGQTGIIFEEYTSDSLKKGIDRAFEVYSGHARFEMVQNALKEDFSWDRSAQEYKNLYKKVIELRNK